MELTVSDWLSNNEFAQSYRAFLKSVSKGGKIQPAHDQALLHAFDLIKSVVPTLKQSQPNLKQTLENLLSCISTVQHELVITPQTPLIQVSFKGRAQFQGSAKNAC